MSLPNQKPEVEGTDIQRRAAREAAACVREKPIAKAGSEPISVWVFAACGLAAVAAGAILGGAGKGFDYNKVFRDSYVRTPPPGGADEGPPPKAAMDAYMARGKKVWNSKCITCHQADGKGQGDNFPSLVGSSWALGGTERFSMIVLNGLHGPMSTGKTYSGAAGMPSQNATNDLKPEDLAGVMTYVRNNFGNTKGDIVTVDMAKAAFSISAKRAKAGQQTTSEELAAEHVKDLPGKSLEAKAMVNPLTLMPVFAKKAPDAAAPAAPK
jgi:mono/diheme cytochrome c family protein